LKTIIQLSILCTLLILVSCSTANSQYKEAQPQSSLELTAVLGGYGFFMDTLPVNHVSVTLFNTSTDTLKIVSMTCSYEDMFTTNSDSCKVQSRLDCFSNYPTLITLPPKSRTDRFLMVNRKMTPQVNNLKIGMYYVLLENGVESKNISELYEQRKQADIIWSNELDLRRLNKSNY
jgi:hypothetical protein